ncbi:MAG: DUF1559 domain-containing protein [Planctomycetes bacterium]|nr:DUF1559 domain-containing protein [Planctomycetota bacterium]
MARRVKRHGFTLIELMVVIAIIALLATMSFRGITKARETARKLRCSQQLRDIATALNQYEIDRRQYPGYRNVLLMTNNASFTNPNNPGQGGVSWAVPVLPYLDYTAVYDAMRTPVTGSPGGSGSGSGGSGGGGTTGPIVSSNYAQITIENFSCPSDPPSTAGGTPLAYVVNSGCIDTQGTPRTTTTAGVPRDWPANGVFFDRFTGNPTASYTGSGGSQANTANMIPQVQQSNSWIGQRDGLVQTIMLTENVDHGQYMDVLEQALGCIWDIMAQVQGNQQSQPGSPPPQAMPTQPNYRINANKGVGASTQAGSLFTQSSGSSGSPQQYQYTRPSSMHIGGANVAYCDGHVGFLNEQMEYFVYCLLMSADGKNVKQPGQTQPLQNNWFKLPVDDAWVNP